ncbi:MAG: trimethylamine methyltransferase family protein [Thermoplasmata archaeon]
MSGIAIRRPYPVLSSDDIGRIHASALQGLERIGVRIGTARGRDLLAKAGAEVDEGSHVARIPASLVEEAIAKTAKRIVLAARNPAQDADLDFQHVHICNDGNGPLAVDFETGERRASTSDDLAKCALVSNALDNLHVFWPMVTSQDMTADIRTFVDLKVSFMHTDKHVQFATAVTVADAKRLTAMASAVAGDEDELRRRPLVSSVHTSIAPLQHDGGNMDAALTFGEAGIPVAIFTMPSPGASGPVTLAGSITVAAMEFLSGLTMCQLATPGAPVIWGTGIAPLDMKTTTRAGGSPEHGLTGAAITQLAHDYGVPSLCGGFDCTASVPGTQAAMEKFSSGVSLVLGGADLIVGTGLLEDARTLWLEQLFVDDEMIQMIRRIADGITVDESTIALDVIEKVGIGKTFLGQRHTMQNLRREHFLPKLVDRRSYDLWAQDGRRSIEDRARAKVKTALAAPPPNPLEPDVVRTLDALIDGARVATPAA